MSGGVNMLVSLIVGCAISSESEPAAPPWEGSADTGADDTSAWQPDATDTASFTGLDVEFALECPEWTTAPWVPFEDGGTLPFAPGVAPWYCARVWGMSMDVARGPIRLTTAEGVSFDTDTLISSGSRSGEDDRGSYRWVSMMLGGDMREQYDLLYEGAPVTLSWAIREGTCAEGSEACEIAEWGGGAAGELHMVATLPYG